MHGVPVRERGGRVRIMGWWVASVRRQGAERFGGDGGGHGAGGRGSRRRGADLSLLANTNKNLMTHPSSLTRSTAAEMRLVPFLPPTKILRRVLLEPSKGGQSTNEDVDRWAVEEGTRRANCNMSSSPPRAETRKRCSNGLKVLRSTVLSAEGTGDDERGGDCAPADAVVAAELSSSVDRSSLANATAAASTYLGGIAVGE